MNIYAFKFFDTYGRQYIKVGQTERNDVIERIEEEFPFSTPEKQYEVIFEKYGLNLTDHEVRAKIKDLYGIKTLKSVTGTTTECYKANMLSVDMISSAINYIVYGSARTLDYKPLPRQKKMNDWVLEQFKHTDNVLLFCKPRFGKTFATLHTAKEYGANKILILTAKPVAEPEWRKEATNHVEFDDYEYHYIGGNGNTETLEDFQKGKEKKIAIVSYQTIFTSTGIKPFYKWISDIEFDVLIVDEYHFACDKLKAIDFVNKNIKRRKQMSISGTPFNCIKDGQFSQRNIFTYSYIDEINDDQNAVKLNLYTYHLPDMMKDIEIKTDLSSFFEADGSVFKDERRVRRFLELITGNYFLDNEGNPDSIFDAEAPMTKNLKHFVFRMDGVDSCRAMYNLLKKLKKENDPVYKNFDFLPCYDGESGYAGKAAENVKSFVASHDRTIVLTCGTCMTCTTVSQWDGIFMLCNLNSAQEYFQNIFRVQNPYGDKRTGYVFDFDVNRSLRMVANYADYIELGSMDGGNYLKNLIKAMPIYAVKGGSCRLIKFNDVVKETLKNKSKFIDNFGAKAVVSYNKAYEGRLLTDDKFMSVIGNFSEHKNEKVNPITISKNDNVKKISKFLNSNGKEKKHREVVNIQAMLRSITALIPRALYNADIGIQSINDFWNNSDEDYKDYFKDTFGISVEDFKYVMDSGVYNKPLLNEMIRWFQKTNYSPNRTQLLSMVA